ncbi:MAG TPA: glycosyltransferase [Candidatus Binatia bacterium]|jgi:GT2 family glycosyltransferase
MVSLSDQLNISAIVPFHKESPDFRYCLEELSRTVPRPYEIIVVADGETGGLAEEAGTIGARVLRLPVAGGPARARNLGAGAATGDILLFIDSDVLVSRETIGKVAVVFKETADLAALIGSYDDEPGAVNFLSQYKNLLHHYVHQTGRVEASTFWGACGAIRRKIFFELGGFDETYRYPSIEDVELGYRLKQAGYRIRLCKDLQVKHLKRWGVRSLLTADIFRRALPWTELILRHRHVLNDLNLRRSSRVSALLAVGLALSLIGAWWKIGLLGRAAVIGILLLALNAPLYLFFFRKRGPAFTFQAVLWHWFYYLYSAVAFAAGAVLYLADSGLARRRRPHKTAAQAGDSNLR